MAFSEGGKQKKAERRGQEDALDFESRDRHKNPRRRFTFSGLILEKKKKRQVETGTNFHGLFLGGQTAPVKVFFSITNGKQKTTAHEKRGGGGGDCCQRSCLNPLGPASEREELWRSV